MKYDVYGVGNALVDMEYVVEDSFLSSNNIEKGLMTLVDEGRQTELVTALNSSNEANQQCGGSAANSIIAISQFGGKSFYSFKVANDQTGQFYLNDIKKNGVSTKNNSENLPSGTTGKCMVMVTPDAERTMNTYLGITETLSSEQIDKEAILNSKWIYIEGYLVASPTGFKAAVETRNLAIANDVKVSLTMSDPNMVKFFRENMTELIGSGVDLLFCNEQEALEFTGKSSTEEAGEVLKACAKSFIITLGSKGAKIWNGETYINIAPHEIKAIDSNGAGDMFAGAYLYGITNGLSIEEAGSLASLASSKVVSKFGPRLSKEQAQSLV